MIAKQMETVLDMDIVMAKKMCKVFGFEPKVMPATNARRNLFGSVEDSTTILELLTEQTIEMTERAAREWNFDFITESPIPGGRYLWEKVQSCDVPNWYTGTVHRKTSCSKSQSCDSVGEKENTLSCANNTSTSDKATVKCNKTKLVQTSIKGYMKVQKRRTSKRLRLKRLDTKFLNRPSRVADYILRGTSKSS